MRASRIASPEAIARPDELDGVAVAEGKPATLVEGSNSVTPAEASRAGSRPSPSTSTSAMPLCCPTCQRFDQIVEGVPGAPPPQDATARDSEEAKHPDYRTRNLIDRISTKRKSDPWRGNGSPDDRPAGGRQFDRVAIRRIVQVDPRAWDVLDGRVGEVAVAAAQDPKLVAVQVHRMSHLQPRQQADARDP